MTEETVDLSAAMGNLLEHSHGDVLRSILAKALHQIMEAEVSTLCGAGYGERCNERENQRNGYRLRPLETRVGHIDLSVPKLRQGSYLPSFVEPRRRWEQAFVAVVAEAYVHGVSTRKVEELVEAMGAKGMSKTEVSRMAQSLDEQVTAFRTRKFDKAFPYVWFDALYVKVREGGRIVSKAVMVAIGINEEGDREILGLAVAQSEMEVSWRSFMRSLVERGLRGVKLVMSDAHEGLRAALRAVFNGVSWQRCYVHFIRNVLAVVPKTAQGFVAAALRNVFQQTSLAQAKDAMGKVVSLLEEKYPNAALVVLEAEEDVLTYFSFPEAHWKQIRSTNPLERLNKELRRRVRVVGIFPNDASVLRLVGMLLVEQHDEWAVSRKYFSTASMAALHVETAALEDRHAAA
jgi:putative transposase